MHALYRARHSAFAHNMVLPGYTGSPGDRPKPPILPVRYGAPPTINSRRRTRQPQEVEAQARVMAELRQAHLVEYVDDEVVYLGFDVAGSGTGL